LLENTGSEQTINMPIAAKPALLDLTVNAGLKLHQSPEQQCTIWQILVGVKVRHFSGCRFVHRPARRSAPTEQRSCAGLWSNRGAVFAL
jgi:hypothetical protein